MKIKNKSNKSPRVGNVTLPPNGEFIPSDIKIKNNSGIIDTFDNYSELSTMIINDELILHNDDDVEYSTQESLDILGEYFDNPHNFKNGVYGLSDVLGTDSDAGNHKITNSNHIQVNSIGSSTSASEQLSNIMFLGDGSVGSSLTLNSGDGTLLYNSNGTELLKIDAPNNFINIKDTNNTDRFILAPSGSLFSCGPSSIILTEDGFTSDNTVVQYNNNNDNKLVVNKSILLEHVSSTNPHNVTLNDVVTKGNISNRTIVSNNDRSFAARNGGYYGASDTTGTKNVYLTNGDRFSGTDIKIGTRTLDIRTEGDPSNVYMGIHKGIAPSENSRIYIHNEGKFVFDSNCVPGGTGGTIISDPTKGNGITCTSDWVTTTNTLTDLQNGSAGQAIATKAYVDHVVSSIPAPAASPSSITMIKELYPVRNDRTAWSSNTNYDHVVTVNGAEVGDTVIVNPNRALYNKLKNNSIGINVYAAVTAINVVNVSVRITSYLGLNTSDKLIITIIK